MANSTKQVCNTWLSLIKAKAELDYGEIVQLCKHTKTKQKAKKEKKSTVIEKGFNMLIENEKLGSFLKW